MCKRMKIKHLALVILFLGAFGGFAQQFRFSEFSFANNGGAGNPNDAIGTASGTGYHGSPDWVEIYCNSSTTTYSISGWYLSDDRYNLRKWQFPTAITSGGPIWVNAKGVVVVYLCEHDKAVTPALGPNASTIDIDLHTNFSLNQTKPGSKLYLSQNNGFLATVKDSIDVSRYKNKPGHSWGREHRDTPVWPTWVVPSTWRLYQTPSPGLPNPAHPPSPTPMPNPPYWFVDYCPTPDVDLNPGYYSGLSSVTLNVTDTACAQNLNSQWFNYAGYGGVEIYGTNDVECPPPTYNNPKAQLITSGGTTGTPLTGQFSVGNAANSPAVIVRLMTTDRSSPQRYLDSWEFYGAYIDDSLRTDHKISVTCVCVDTGKLFNGATLRDSLPMIIHHFDKSDKEAFKNIGQGHTAKIDYYNPIGPVGPTTNEKMWQFVFRSEDEYGYRWTNTSQLFKDATLGYSDRTDFPEIMFRSAAEENFLFPGLTAPFNFFLPAHVRDFFNHTMGLRHKLRFDQAHYAPTYMIMNGFPRGIYYIKETIDSLYTKEYYDRPRAAIITNNIYGTNQVVAGTASTGVGAPNAATQWSWFYTWAMQTNTNVHIPTLYYRIADSLDFNSLNDYMIYNFLSVNTDFIKRYGMWWKGLPTDTTDHREAKWRFALTNTDFTWGYDVFNSASVSNTSPSSEPCDYLGSYSLNWPSPGNTPGNTTYPIIPLWFKLMSNDTFKSEFITRYADLLNTALTCDSLTDHLKYIRSLLTTGDMNGHVWYNLGDPNGTCIGCDSLAYWNDQLDSIKVFIMQRCSLVTEGLVNCFPEIEGPYNFCVDVDPPNSGYVHFNSLDLKNFVWNGKYFDSIINVIEAIPYQNYMFDHWETKYTLSPGNTSDSATFYIPADGCVKAIFKLRPPYETYGEPMLPTGFSPNGDGNNDILNIYGIAEASSYEMDVYNRWGEQIFHSVDKTQGWDGKFNGTEVPAGVYAYRYNLIINGKTYKANGNITLVR